MILYAVWSVLTSMSHFISYSRARAKWRATTHSSGMDVARQGLSPYVRRGLEPLIARLVNLKEAKGENN